MSRSAYTQHAPYAPSPDTQAAACEQIVLKPCPDGHPRHRLIHVDAEVTNQLGLPDGSALHLDTRRRPANGDTVLAEVLVGQRMIRTVRRFLAVDGSRGVVSLARVGGPPRSLLRRRYEVGILGVVDGHLRALDGSPDAP